MTHVAPPSDGLVDPVPSARRVDVIRIRLEVLVDTEAQLLEWKMRSLRGELGALMGMLRSQPVSASQLPAQLDLMRSAMLQLLSEYCEPF